MNIENTKSSLSNSKIIWTVVFTLVFLGCFYCQIFVFPWGNDKLVGVIGIMSLLAVIFMWSKIRQVSKLGRVIPYLIFLGPIIGQIVLTSQLREMYIEDQLGKYGVMINGEIVNIYTQFNLRSSNRKLATLAYRYNGQVIYNDLNNSKEKIHMRDRVKLMYSSNNPHIFSVLRIDEYSPTADAHANQASDSQLKGGKPPYTFLDGPPRFPGDMPGLYAYLRSNVIYPEEAKKQRITGKVFVSFVITQDGSVTDVKIEKGIGGGCDEAAIEAVTNMPRWTPGSQNGKPIRVKYNIPISFSL